ncbi:MAG: type II toxin-antitoxin system prevent-host-death family antitoxin [Bacteroidetes bacterium]|nr:MAG: type II toxin-antitoxin system prevent-host-death family antitoxin [Bacteroidota bacterium]
MESISVNRFRENLRKSVEKVVKDHAPLKVTRRNGEDFIVMSVVDWDREQETLYILQNNELMKQIASSIETHQAGKGYRPSPEEMDEITGI